MIVSIPCPSGPRPIGGVTALYEFGNALARRGHEVHLIHADYFGCRIESLDDLSWFRFDPAVRHHIASVDAIFEGAPAIPRSDVIFGTGLPGELGLPVHLVQGFEMLYPWFERAAFRTPSLKVCIASWLVDVGTYYGVGRDRFRVVPMGIDHERFRPPPVGTERRFDVAVLYNSHPAKGWGVARDALELVRAERPDLEVAVFGATEPDEELPRWMSFRRDPGVDALVSHVYGASKVFLQASDYEGFGFTAVEAMACGAALVTTDNGGSRDYAVQGETALVVEPRDAAAMARAVDGLLADDGLRTAVAEAGERFVRRFEWDLGAELLEAHLLEYLADPEPFLVEPGPLLLDERVDQGQLAAEVLKGRQPGRAPAR